MWRKFDTHLNEIERFTPPLPNVKQQWTVLQGCEMCLCSGLNSIPGVY